VIHLCRLSRRRAVSLSDSGGKLFPNKSFPACDYVPLDRKNLIQIDDLLPLRDKGD
jgi:hypothetical protein